MTLRSPAKRVSNPFQVGPGVGPVSSVSQCGVCCPPTRLAGVGSEDWEKERNMHRLGSESSLAQRLKLGQPEMLHNRVLARPLRRN